MRSATAVAGPIAFVAFMAGPIARLPARPVDERHRCRRRWWARRVTLGADLVAQHLLFNVQLPVGVVTGGIGALFLIAMLIAANRTGRTA